MGMGRYDRLFEYERQGEFVTGAKVPGSVVASFASLFQGSGANRDVWLDAESFTQSGGKVTAWVDRQDASHTFLQASSPLQVGVPAAHADFGGKNCATAVAASYVSDRPAAFWAAFHSGAGGTILHTFTPLGTAGIQTLCANHTIVDNTQLGMYCTWFNTNQYNYEVGNGTQNVTLGTSTGPVNVGTPTYWAWSAAGASGTGMVVARKRGVAQSVTGTTANAPSAASASPMFLFSDASGLLNANLRWRSSFFFRRAFTAAEFAVAEAFVRLDTGLL